MNQTKIMPKPSIFFRHSDVYKKYVKRLLNDASTISGYQVHLKRMFFVTKDNT